MRRSILLILAAAVVLAALGCASDQPATTKPSPTTQDNSWPPGGYMRCFGCYG